MASRAHQPSAVLLGVSLLGVSLLGLTLSSCSSSGVSTALEVPGSSSAPWGLNLREDPASALSASQQAAADHNLLLLATARTSTMQREMQQAADAGYSLAGIQGGKTAWGSWELVVIMQRNPDSTPRAEYWLLATSKTSTMQEELQLAGNSGFVYRAQTSFNKETVVILERNRDLESIQRIEYKLLATTKTSTMQQELLAATVAGFNFAGVTVAEHLFGNKEIVTILSRPVTEN